MSPQGVGAPRQGDWREFGGILALSVVIQIPFLEMCISLLDEGSILALGEAISSGKLLYRDHVTVLAPAIYELLGALFRVLGTSVLVARLFAAAIFTGCVGLIWAIAHRAAGVGAARAASLAFVVLKPVAYPLWTVLSYSQLAMLFCLVSVWMVQRFLVDRRGRWLAGAGVSVALCVLTKQNLGALMASIVSLTVALDWLFGPRRFPTLASRALVLMIASGATVALALLRYALAGGLGELLQHAVLEVVSAPAAYFVPLPGLAPWGASGESLALLAFTYLPPAFSALTLEGSLPVTPSALAPLEWAAKACYLLPLLALGAAVVLLVRDAQRGADRHRWTELALTSAFAGGTYATMLYRADWAHLMNIYPPQLLLIALLVTRWSHLARAGRRVGFALFGIWLCFAAASGAALAIGEREAVETVRGTLYDSSRNAEYTRRVLAHVAARPESERIAFLPAVPLYYFLSARPVGLPLDMLIPGIASPDEDRRVAAALADVDRVVYDPTRLPSVHTEIGEYAPETSEHLARRFGWSEILAPNAFVLTRRSADDAEPKVRLEPWARRNEAARTRWLFHRVLETPIGPETERACVGFAHTPARGDWLEATPMFEPRMWSDEHLRALLEKPAPARIVVEAVDSSGAASRLHAGRLSPGLPGLPLRLSLDAFAGRPIELRLCAVALVGARNQSPIGWADVRVLARSTEAKISDASRRP